MLEQNHKRVNKAALLPICTYILKFRKEDFFLLLPKSPTKIIATLVATYAIYNLTSILPDIDRNKWIPFKHRTWLHTIWIPLFTLYLAYINKGSKPILTLFLIAFSISYYLHIQMDDFSVMGCDMFYPIFGYKKYYGGIIKYRKGPFHFEFYDAGSRKGQYKVIMGKKVKKKPEERFVKRTIIFFVGLSIHLAYL